MGKGGKDTKKDSSSKRSESEKVQITYDKKSNSKEDTDAQPGSGKEVEALTLDDMAVKLQEKEKDRQEIYDRLLRIMADFENHKKRVKREKEDLIKYGNEQFAIELLPVLDNFERAIKEARSAKDTKSIIEGLEMILGQFQKVLEKFGIRGFNAVGEPFDPEKHEAIAHQESTLHEENTVIEEFQKGYFLHDRLLRPARAVVAKRPSKDEKGTSSSDTVSQEEGNIKVEMD